MSDERATAVAAEKSDLRRGFALRIVRLYTSLSELFIESDELAAIFVASVKTVKNR